MRRVVVLAVLAALIAGGIAVASLQSRPSHHPAKKVAAAYHEPRPARPVEVSARGGVAHYPADYWSSEDTDTARGEYVVARTAKGTWGISGLVDSARQAGVNNARVTLRSCTNRSFRVTTHTNVDGEFTFVDVPTTTFWVLRVWRPQSALLGRYIQWLRPGDKGETYQLTIDLTRKPQNVSDWPGAMATRAQIKAIRRRAAACKPARRRP
jgi:hypothetical protein